MGWDGMVGWEARPGSKLREGGLRQNIRREESSINPREREKGGSQESECEMRHINLTWCFKTPNSPFFFFSFFLCRRFLSYNCVEWKV